MHDILFHTPLRTWELINWSNYRQVLSNNSLWKSMEISPKNWCVLSPEWGDYQCLLANFNKHANGSICRCRLWLQLKVSGLASRVKIWFEQSFKKLRRRVRSHRKSGRLGRKKHPNSLSKLKKSRAFSVNPCRAGKCPKKQKATLEFQLRMFGIVLAAWCYMSNVSCFLPHATSRAVSFMINRSL